MKTNRRRKAFLIATATLIMWTLSVALIAIYAVTQHTAFLVAFIAATLAFPLSIGASLFGILKPMLQQRKVRASQLNAATRELVELKTTAAGIVELKKEISAVRDLALTRSADNDGILDVNRSVRTLGEALSLPLSAYMSLDQAVAHIRAALDSDQPLEALPWLRAFEQAVDHLSLSECRELFKYFRQVGYLKQSVLLIEHIAQRFGKERDRKRAEIYRSELELYKGSTFDFPELPSYKGKLGSKTVLHLVGKVLPGTQSGYTLRTQYTVEALKRAGLEPVVVGQVGASDHRHDLTETYEHDGIRYYLLGGPRRGEGRWDEWMSKNVEQLADVVRLTQPAVLHAHSDFMNSWIAQTVGDAYGIPVVNETRGFWEESWLSRTATAEAWESLETIEQKYGLPDMYQLRVEREAEARSKAAYVVTLAGVMERHIRRLGSELELPVELVGLAPNAVQANEFPIIPHNHDLVGRLGLPPDTIILGYISSMVEYEGIDTLVRALYELNAAVGAVEDLAAAKAGDTVVVGGEEATASEFGSAEGDPDQTNGSLRDLRSVASLPQSLGTGADLDTQVPAAALSGASDHDPAKLKAIHGVAASLRKLYSQQTDIELSEMAERLVESANGLAGSPVHLLLVGGGPSLDALEALAVELNVKNITFTGRIPHEEVLEYYGAIDLFIVPRKPVAVTQLVTPLKPFEAMSTGRPCLFSDVDALDEIARESGAAATFRAGDSNDLAIQIGALFQDRDRLATMATAGARWVRAERSWDINAYEYLRTYAELGLAADVPRHVKAEIELRSEGINGLEIVQQLTRSEAPGMRGWFSLIERKRGIGKGGEAHGIIKNGWTGDRHRPILLVPGLDWDEITRENRSWGFKLHSWEFIDPVLDEYLQTGESELLRWATEVALDWWRYVSDGLPDNSMAWYDMSLSLRMARLARLMIYLARSEFTDETIHFVRMAMLHAEKSMADEAFNARNNHGFYCAVAQCDFARLLPSLPDATRLKAQGSERLAIMLDRQFAKDGGHIEHSPDYHRMLLSSFEKAMTDGLIDDPEHSERITRAAYVMGWMVQPDGYLVQFGDTPLKKMDTSSRGSIDDHTLFILKDGAAGAPDSSELLALPDSGYAFVRSPQPSVAGERLQSSYLAFMAGFHSRAHKHADDLTFTWFDRGRELIVDSGRFGYVDLLPADSPDRLRGYYYASRERQYVESTRAHNTVSVDGLDIERRLRRPYGSALGECEEVDGQFVLRGLVNYENYQHGRELRLVPHKILTVVDQLVSKDGTHDATTWFNMDGNLTLTVEGDQIKVVLPDSGEPLWISGSGELIPPVHGQSEPMRGWRSKVDGTVEPVWNFGFRGRFEDETILTTVFRFGGDRAD